MTVDRDLVAQAIARGRRGGKKRSGGRNILAVILVVLLAVGGVAWGVNRWFQIDRKPVTPLSQEKAETMPGVKLAADVAGFKISDRQAEQGAKMIEAAKDRPPDEVIPSSGGVKQDVEKIVKAGGGFAIVTDPARPKETPKLEALPIDKALNLNVYHMKPYPNRMVELTVYPSLGGVKAADVAYMSRVTVFKRTGYLGPVVSYDADRQRGKVRIGVRLAVPLD